LGLLEVLAFFTVLGLFDVQPTAHVLGFVVLEGQVQALLVVEFHEGHSLGSSGVAVGQEVNGLHGCEGVEVGFDVFLGSVVGESGDSGLEFLSWVGLGGLGGGGFGLRDNFCLGFNWFLLI